MQTTTDKSSILVVGSVNMDFIFRGSRMPLPGESLMVDTFHEVPGGKGANQAVAAARLGACVTFGGKIGNDAHGLKLKRNLEAEGVSTSWVVVDGKVQTGLAVIVLDAAGQNSIVVFPGANREIRKEELCGVFEQGRYDAVLLQMEVPQDVVLECSRLALAAGIPVVLDAGPAQQFPLEELSGVEILTPNETEALALTGLEIHTLDDAARASSILMARSKACSVVLKLGEKGALLRTRDGVVEHFPAHSVEVIDTTAAGDAFTAALTVSYLRFRDLRGAVAYGNLAGAFATTRLGAQPSLPTRAELETFGARLQVTRETYV